MPKRVKWGIIGSANIAQTQFLPGLMDANNAVLHAVGSRDKGKAHLIADRFGAPKAYGSYQEVIDDPDVEAVYIPLPNHLHKEWTLQALRAKKHVLCEKPMALTVDECNEMLVTAKQEGQLFMEAFMYRFHPQIFKVEELVKADRIGDVRLIRASFSFLIDKGENIRLSKASGGGSLMDVGCYPIHFANLLFEGIPHTVYASGDYSSERDIDMSMSGILHYNHNCQAIFDCSFVMEDRQEVEIVGAKGMITILLPWRPDQYAATIIIKNGEQEETINFPPSNPYQLEVEHFSQCILEKQIPLMPGEMGRAVVAVMEACHKSASTGAAVGVKE